MDRANQTSAGSEAHERDGLSCHHLSELARSQRAKRSSTEFDCAQVQDRKHDIEAAAEGGVTLQLLNIREVKGLRL